MSTEPHQTLVIPPAKASSAMASAIAPEKGTGDSEKGLSPASPPPEMERQIKGIKWIIICVGFYIADFLYGLDNTVAADIQSAVLGTYGEITKLSWLGTGFPLGSIATILTL
jgi:hypothetical protein